MLPAFRDWIIPPYYYNQKGIEFSILSIEQNLYNVLVQYFSEPFVVYGYIFLWLLIGIYLSFVGIKNSNYLINSTNKINNWFYLLLSFFYIFNIWTIERFLMGQIHVLRGHFLLPISLYFLLKTVNSPKVKNILSYSGILFVIGFISIHHLYFLGLLTIGYLITKYIKSNKKNSLNYILPALSFFPAFVYIIYKIYFLERSNNLAQAINLENKQEIISSFSLKINEFIGIDNIFISGILGSGSWMINTFFELFDTLDSIGFARFFLPYFNNLLAYVFGGLIVICLTWFLSKIKNFNTEYQYFGIASIISLILSFGYSLAIFTPFNKLFFLLPSSYIIRESGKWYSLFLLGLVFIFLSLKKDYLGRALTVILALFTTTNIVFASVLIPHLNFKKHPQILSEVNKYCKENNIKKSIYLPNQTYIQSEFSGDIFIEKYWYMAADCGFIKSEYSTIGEETKTLNQTQFDKEYQDVFSSFSCKDNTISSFFEKNEIELIAIDTTYYPELLELQECLDGGYNEILSSEGIKILYSKIQS